MNDIQELTRVFEAVVNRMASHPVTVIQTESMHTLTFEVKCEPGDVGKLVGLKGAMVDALEFVFTKMAAVLDKKKAIVNVVKTPVREKDFGNFRFNPDYHAEPEITILTSMVEFIYNDGVTVIASPNDSADEAANLDLVISHYTQDADTHRLKVALNTIFTAIGIRQGMHLCVRFES